MYGNVTVMQFLCLQSQQYPSRKLRWSYRRVQQIQFLVISDSEEREQIFVIILWYVLWSIYLLVAGTIELADAIVLGTDTHSKNTFK